MLNESLQAMRERLRSDVQRLAVEIGERNLDHYPALEAAAAHVERSLAQAGYRVDRQEFAVEGHSCWNLQAELPGRVAPDEIIVVAAHYDSVIGSPGANDNGSGVAALLELARRFAGREKRRTLRFVAFANEEPPYFQTPEMGSWVYARTCRQRQERIRGAVVLETIGYYTDQPSSQSYPPPLGLLYPSTGNFLAVVGNVGSRRLVRRVVGTFRREARFPCEGGAVPSIITGVGWSDHWSFWQEGYPAVMCTDTAPYRYPHYHLRSDLPDKLRYDELTLVVEGLAAVVEDLTDGEDVR